MKRLTASVLILTMLTGCATASRDIAASYHSPLAYQSYDCTQIGAEQQRISARVQQLGGRLDQAATNDKLIMAATLLVFWPAAFALGGTKEQEAEFATLKGQFDAIQQASIEKKCGLTAAGGPAPAAPVAAPTASAPVPPVAPAAPLAAQAPKA